MSHPCAPGSRLPTRLDRAGRSCRSPSTPRAWSQRGHGLTESSDTEPNSTDGGSRLALLGAPLRHRMAPCITRSARVKVSPRDGAWRRTALDPHSTTGPSTGQSVRQAIGTAPGVATMLRLPCSAAVPGIRHHCATPPQGPTDQKVGGPSPSERAELFLVRAGSKFLRRHFRAPIRAGF